MRVSLSRVIRRIAGETDKEESAAQGIYAQYMMSPLGMTLVQSVLKKYPGYNLDTGEAKKATDVILADMKRRVMLFDKDLDAEKIFKSLESKVLAGIT